MYCQCYHSLSYRKSMEGQLSKFTNLVKGWQNRWFVLDAESGNLAYFLVMSLHCITFTFNLIFFWFGAHPICFSNILVWRTLINGFQMCQVFI